MMAHRNVNLSRSTHGGAVGISRRSFAPDAAVTANVAATVRHVASFALSPGVLAFAANDATSAAGLRHVDSYIG
jgi:hypothetical protein